MKRHAPNRDIVFDLRCLYRDLYRDRSLVLSDRQVRQMWDAHAHITHAVVRECHVLETMRNAVQRAREQVDIHQERVLGLLVGNVTTLAA